MSGLSVTLHSMISNVIKWLHKIYLPEEWNCGCLILWVVDVHGCGVGLRHNFEYNWRQSAGNSKYISEKLLSGGNGSGRYENAVQ